MRAGHAFSVSLEMVHREFSEPLAGEFRRTFEEQNLGLPLEIVLQKLAKRVPSLDVHFFVSAVLLQKRTGGNLAELLDKLAYIDPRALQAARAHPRGQRAGPDVRDGFCPRIPVGVAVMMFVVNPEYARFFVDDPMGTNWWRRAWPATGRLPDHPQDCDDRGVTMLEMLSVVSVPAGGRRDLPGLDCARGAWRARQLAPAGAACGPRPRGCCPPQP